jgi:hypothetical protein
MSKNKPSSIGVSAPAGERQSRAAEAVASPLVENGPVGRSTTGRFVVGNPIGVETRFKPGNGQALVSGAQSWLVRHGLADGQQGVAEALALDKAGMLADLGGVETVSVIKSRLVDSLLETIALKRWCADRISAVGPWGPSGRLRPVVGTFLKAVECQRQLSVTLGLGRKARRVPSVSEYLAGASVPSDGDRS